MDNLFELDNPYGIGQREVVRSFGKSAGLVENVHEDLGEGEGGAKQRFAGQV